MTAHAQGGVENNVVSPPVRPSPTGRSAETRPARPDSEAWPLAAVSPDHDGAHPAPSYAELEAEVGALRAEAGRSRQILASAIDHAIITMDLDGRVTSWNPGAQRIMGYTEAEILGRSGEVVFTSEDRAEGRFIIELCHAIETGHAANERWHLRQDGTRFWASGTMMSLLDADGQPEGFLNILRDLTDARAEVERRELLMAEMDHRIKNTLSTVQAVAIQTGHHCASITEFRAVFGARLMALARSHDVLIRGGWENASLREVVEGSLAAYGGEPGRITITGTSVRLAANLVVMVSLAFHELATNAAKYGSLSRPGGRVDVTWTLSPATRDGRWVEILWRERGGPAVRLSERRGFGSQLLGQGLGGGTVRQEFLPEGLQCRISLPLGSVPSAP